MNAITAPPQALLALRGKIKTFGPFGPKYEVEEPIAPLADGDWRVKTRLVETGEETEYRYTHLRDDPEAR